MGSGINPSETSRIPRPAFLVRFPSRQLLVCATKDRDYNWAGCEHPFENSFHENTFLFVLWSVLLLFITGTIVPSAICREEDACETLFKLFSDVCALRLVVFIVFILHVDLSIVIFPYYSFGATIYIHFALLFTIGIIVYYLRVTGESALRLWKSRKWMKRLETIAWRM